MENDLKILKSYRQSVIADNATKDKIYKDEKIITFEGDRFSFELPNGGVLTGTMAKQEPQNGKEIYLTDKECPIAISNDEIFINLYRTHNMACTYYLGEASKQKNKSFFSKIFGS